MKKKIKAGLNVLALGAGAVALGLAIVPPDAVRAEGETEVDITLVQTATIWYTNAQSYTFKIGDDKDFGVWWEKRFAVNSGMTYVDYKGNAVATNGIYPFGSDIIFDFNCVGGLGAVLKFEAGATFTSSSLGSFKLKNSAAYINKLGGKNTGTWAPYIEPTSVTTSETAKTIELGETYTINAAVDTTEENPLIFYESADTSVATVSDTGVVSAVSPGTTKVTVYSGLKTAEMTITVNKTKELSSIALKDTSTRTLNQGDELAMLTSGLKGVKSYDDGTSSEFDITADMLDASTFNSETLGEQTVKITADGKETNMKVNVVASPSVNMDALTNVFQADQTGWSQYTVIFGDKKEDGTTWKYDIGQYVNLSDEYLAKVKSKLLLNGEEFPMTSIKNLGGARYCIYSNATLKAGDIVTVKKGLRLYQYSGTVDGVTHVAKGDGYFTGKAEVAEDFKYVVTNNSSSIKGIKTVPFEANPTGFTLSSELTQVHVNEELPLTYTLNAPEGKHAYGTPTFASSDETIATVDSNGVVVGKGVGNVTITAKLKCEVAKEGGAEGETEMKEVTQTINLSVVAEQEKKGIVAADGYNYYSILKGADTSAFKGNFTKLKYVYEDDSTSASFDVLDTDTITYGAIDTSTTGEKDIEITWKRGDLTLKGTIKVKVYEKRKLAAPKEVALVDWWNYAIFVQCSNTSTNDVNILDSKPCQSFLDNITYKRKDGTVEEFTTAQLGTNILVQPKFLFDADGNKIVTAENYTTLYQIGDTITIGADCPIYYWTGTIERTADGGKNPVDGTGEYIVDGTFGEELVYKFTENGWIRYIHTEELTAKADAITLKIGKNSLSGVERGPDGANDGTLAFSSDNESVAKVNATTGVISGVAAGTAHITATWTGDDGTTKLTKVITVTVKDYVKSLSGEKTLTLKQGSDLDVSALNLKAVMAGGEEKVLTNNDVTITGYDKNALGEQAVTISYKLDGETVKLTVAITVEAKSGCGGSVVATAVAGVVALIGVGAVAIARKKKEDK